jgi:4-hydroxy-tetrahydrodipicolinate synthase
MVSAKQAREWVNSGGLHGLGDSLYTPFSGADGDDIDYDAYRALVRYCVGDLQHSMLWLCSGLGEWWALTLDERKRLVEIAIDEVREVAPHTVVQVATGSMSAKDSLELTLHAQENGADICYLQTPPMEVHGGEGVLRFFQYVADRTDIALGMFNSSSSGYVLTPAECAAIYHEVPAVCVIKEGLCEPWRSKALHQLVPELAIWECNLIVYRAGWLQEGIVTPAQLGSSAYLLETPEDRRITTYWNLIWNGEIGEAIRFSQENRMDALFDAVASVEVTYPQRPDYFTHWGAAFRYCAEILGLPVGDYHHSRPPQGILGEDARSTLRRAYEDSGLLLVKA